MKNLDLSIDMLGALITERQPGEPLADYRRRVLQTAGVLGHRDASSPDWIRQREIELEGRTGYPVRLRSGVGDAALQAEAERRLFTYDRLAAWEGPFVWPRYGASGERTYYNHGAPAGSGVGSLADLVPMADAETGRYYAQPGFVVIEGQVWYIPARLERAVFRIPASTRETVVVPVHIPSGHWHRFEIIDEARLRLVHTSDDGSFDHEHVLTHRLGTWSLTEARTASGVHTHELLPIQTDGPCFISVSVRNPQIGSGPGSFGAGSTTLRYATRRDTIDGFLGVPVLHLSGLEVTTDDGLHTAWVDPYDYYARRFRIGDDASDGRSPHSHQVRLSDDGASLYAEPAGADQHTHTLPLPAVPHPRLVLPVADGADVEDHPFMVRTRTDRGWTVLSSPYGLGPQLTLAFDTGAVLPIPTPAALRPGYSIGLGPELSASSVYTIAHAPERPAPGTTLTLTLRTEDRLSGGVPAVQVRAALRYWLGGSHVGPQTPAAFAVTNAEAEARLHLQTDDTLAYDAVEVVYELSDEGGWQPAGSYLITLAHELITQPIAPRLIAPAAGAEAVPAEVTFRWTPVRGAAYYLVEVAEDPTFQALVAQLTLSATETVRTLAYMKHYYWRVKARGEFLDSPWSTSEFRTLVPPPAPTLIAPYDDAIVGDPPN